MSSDEQKPARNILPELIIPVLAVAFTIYYLTTITEVPWIAQASAVFVACLLFIAVFAYAVRTIGRIRRGEEKITFGNINTVPNFPIQIKRGLLLTAIIGYIVLLEPLGFTLATFLFLFSGVVTLSSLQNWKAAVKVAAICSILGYLIFILFFKTRFPKGFFENAVEALQRYGA
jgi:hypothetical protein